MKEIIDINEVEKLIALLAWLFPVIGVGGALIIGVSQKRVGFWLARLGLAGLSGPALWLLWRMYSYLVRFAPGTGYFGLERVPVLLLILLIFIVVGIAGGFLAAKLAQKYR